MFNMQHEIIYYIKQAKLDFHTISPSSICSSSFFSKPVACSSSLAIPPTQAK